VGLVQERAEVTHIFWESGGNHAKHAFYAGHDDRMAGKRAIFAGFVDTWGCRDTMKSRLVMDIKRY
jgi:hypothetical protein